MLTGVRIGSLNGPDYVLVIGGKTNDTAPQNQPLPLGPGGRSVLFEGLGSSPLGKTVVAVGGGAPGYGSTLAAPTQITDATDASRPLWAAIAVRDNLGVNGISLENNAEGTLLASAARTIATASADQTNRNGRGLLVILNITVASGTGGLTIQIQGKDPISAAYYTLNAAPTAIIATGLYVYEISPGSGTAGAPGTGLVQQRTQGILPRTYRVNVAVGDASSYTYSVAFALVTA